MEKKFDKLHKEVVQIIAHSPIEEDPIHSEEVYKFVLDLYPNAGEDLKIAALCHDIERAVEPRIRRLEGESYEKHKEKHAKRSSAITVKLMDSFGYSEYKKNKVSKLISLHEVGGNRMANILMDADSISYFSSNVDFYFKRSGLTRTRDKILFMYNRASNKAKNIIKSLNYKDDIKKLIFETIEK